jgi:lipopolysaccharide transport system permease protein
MLSLSNEYPSLTAITQSTTPLPTNAPPSHPERLITPPQGKLRLNVRDLWEFRELLLFLTWRDVMIRYKQTVLGGLWAVIQPLGLMVVFSVFLGALAKLPSDGIPYPLFSYAALVPWGFFAAGLQAVSNSVLGNSHLITKVYFPRLIIPLSAILVGLIDFVINFILLLLMAWAYGYPPTLKLLALVWFTGLAMTFALAIGLWLSALNVRYRDIRYVVPFMLQFLMFASPVIYTSSLIPEQWRYLYALNPLVGVMEGFRWALVGGTAPIVEMSVISAGVVIVLLISGLVFFQRVEHEFADIV